MLWFALRTFSHSSYIDSLRVCADKLSRTELITMRGE